MFEKLKLFFKKDKKELRHIPQPLLKGLIDLFEITEDESHPPFEVQKVKDQLDLMIQWANEQSWSKPGVLVAHEEGARYPKDLASFLYELFNRRNEDSEALEKDDARLSERDFTELLAHLNQKNEVMMLEGILDSHLMFQVIAWGHLEIAKKLESIGLNLHQRGIRNLNALHIAIDAGHVEIIPWLMEKGFDVNERRTGKSNKLMLSTLMMANLSMDRKLETASMVIAYGLDLDVIGPQGLTLLHEAIVHCIPPWVELLVNGGASMEVKSKNKRYGAPMAAVAFAESIGNRREIFQYLSEVAQMRQEIKVLNQVTQEMMAEPVEPKKRKTL